MISENQVELVIKCNVRAKSHLRDNQAWWNPSSTSTPIRRPLHPLTNVEALPDCRPYNYLSNHVNRHIAPSKINKLQDIEQTIKGNSLEKDKNEDFYNVLSSDEDESDNKKNKLPKKDLVIKLGNSCNRTFKNKVNKKNAIENNCVLSPEKKAEPEIIEITSAGNEVEDDVKHLKSQSLCAFESTKNLNVKSNDHKINDNEVQEVSVNHISINENKAVEKIAELTDIQNKREKALNNKRGNKILSKKRKDADTSLKDTFVKKFKTVEENLNRLSNVNKNKVKKISKNLTSTKSLNTNSDLEKNMIAESMTQNQTHSDKSTSHEIFSDSKEQELRDSLNLTNSDTEESCKIDNNQNFSLKNEKVQKLSSKSKNLASRKNIHSNIVNTTNSSTEIIQQKRKIKSPREFWLPHSETFENSSPKENASGNEDSSDQSKKEFLKISSSMHSSSPKKIENKILKTKKKHTSKILENNFIKDVSNMQFIKKVKGGKHEFLAAVVWQLSSFKCCVLKIKKNSEIIGKTKEKNSHCGGVILKGKLLMKIQDEEIEVKRGRIFHIPPLTDWKMLNNGRTECLVYYWRGRF